MNSTATQKANRSFCTNVGNCFVFRLLLACFLCVLWVLLVIPASTSLEFPDFHLWCDRNITKGCSRSSQHFRLPRQRQEHAACSKQAYCLCSLRIFCGIIRLNCVDPKCTLIGTGKEKRNQTAQVTRIPSILLFVFFALFFLLLSFDSQAFIKEKKESLPLSDKVIASFKV